MVQVIFCKTCGGDTIGFGNTSITVNYSVHKKVCDHCNHVDETEWGDFFCSEKCFKEWMKEGKLSKHWTETHSVALP